MHNHDLQTCELDRIGFMHVKEDDGQHGVSSHMPLDLLKGRTTGP